MKERREPSTKLLVVYGILMAIAFALWLVNDQPERATINTYEVQKK